MSTASHNVTKPSLHHTWLHREVDHSLLLSVIDAGEHSLVGLLLHHLHLLDELGRNILRSKLRIVEEEGLSIDSDLLDGLTVCCDGTVRLHLHTWEFLEEFLEHIVVRSLERRCVIFDCILLHDDRVTDCRHACRIENLYILSHLHVTEIHILIHSNFLAMSLVAHNLSLELIDTLLHLEKFSTSFHIRKDILVRLGSSLWGEGHCSERYRI